MRISSWIKIIVLSLIFGFGFYYLWEYFKNADATNLVSENDKNYQNLTKKIDVVANIWTAVSVNIWTRHKEALNSEIPSLSEVYEIEYILSNADIARDTLIKENMMAINAYRNSLKIDIKNELNISNDRARTLDFIINKLEYNYINSIENVKTLQEQITILNAAKREALAEANNIKVELDKEFNAWNSISSVQLMDAYIKAKEKETSAHTYIVFINQIVYKYVQLNKINAKLTNTLKTNKEALIKNAKVVIPASGTEYLSELELLFEQR